MSRQTDVTFTTTGANTDGTTLHYLSDMGSSIGSSYGLDPYSQKYYERPEIDNAEVVMFKAVYPKIVFNTSQSKIIEVLGIIKQGTYIIGYRPAIILLSNIEGQLNRLTWE